MYSINRDEFLKYAMPKLEQVLKDELPAQEIEAEMIRKLVIIINNRARHILFNLR